MGLLYSCQMKILKPDCTVEDDYLKKKKGMLVKQERRQKEEECLVTEQTKD